MSFKDKKSSIKTLSEGLFSNEMTREENDLSIESDKNWKKEQLRNTDGDAYEMPWVDNVNKRLLMDWLD